MKIRLLGYDVRVSEHAIKNIWTDNRRQKHLLVSETPWPLSVDNQVWPSVFNYIDDTSEVGISFAQGFIDVSFRSYRHKTLHLWSYPHEMENSFRQAKGQIGIPVSVGVVVGTHEPLGNVLEGTESPAASPSNWTLAGYDVADEWMLSGLSNCGYLPNEKDSLRREWSEKLNAVGLFIDAAEAAKFANLRAVQVPEHAPFYVFELHTGPLLIT